MNSVIDTILNRKSVRAYEKRPIEPDIKAQILQATLRAPTAGNMMLYSIIEVDDQAKKNSLARTCDNQPFIAKAPLVLMYLADYQRWYDYFAHCGVEDLNKLENTSMRRPAEGDLMIACCDALIAAHTTVIAAESFGIGSCYIGDIMERWEINSELFNLPRYTFPICLLCFGYPTRGQQLRKKTSRFDERFIVFKNAYKRLSPQELDNMFAKREQALKLSSVEKGIGNVGQWYYYKKFNADFTIEMTRSVRACLNHWNNLD
jgi:nitroreductase